MSTIGQSFNYNAEAGLSIKLTKQSTSRVEITLKSTSGEVGWAGIGVGEGMMDADIVLCSAGNLGLKRYKGGMGQLSPADAAAIDLQLVPASSSKAATAKGPFQCTFSRKVDNSDSFLKGTAMIWAVGGDDGSKPGYHSARGVFTSDADLQESVPAPTNKPSPSSIPETPGTIDAPTTEMNGDQDVKDEDVAIEPVVEGVEENTLTEPESSNSLITTTTTTTASETESKKTVTTTTATTTSTTKQADNSALSSTRLCFVSTAIAAFSLGLAIIF